MQFAIDQIPTETASPVLPPTLSINLPATVNIMPYPIKKLVLTIPYCTSDMLNSCCIFMITMESTCRSRKFNPVATKTINKTSQRKFESVIRLFSFLLKVNNIEYLFKGLLSGQKRFFY